MGSVGLAGAHLEHNLLDGEGSGFDYHSRGAVRIKSKEG
jgi:hypothetical protein